MDKEAQWCVFRSPVGEITRCVQNTKVCFTAHSFCVAVVVVRTLCGDNTVTSGLHNSPTKSNNNNNNCSFCGRGMFCENTMKKKEN